MQRSWVVLLVIVTTSTLAHAQVSRHEVDEAFAKSIAGSHACGGHYRAVYDWKSYDQLDWAHHDKSKEEQLGYELSNVEIIGAGLDDACDDSDCKAVLANVDTIVYRATGKDSERGLSAQISGHTVTFVNDVFSSTHDGTDYYHALRRGCATATLPDAAADKPSTAKPKNLGKPSAKWDATYKADPILGGVGTELCRPASATALKVAHGKFSVPWLARDWTTEDDEAKPVTVGHLDGVVHDDGTASVAMVWDGRPLAARDVRTVRVKRALDAIKTASVKFKIVGKDKEVQLELDTGEDHCEVGWSIRVAKPVKRDADGDPVIYGNGVKWSQAKMDKVDDYEYNKTSWDHGSIRKSGGMMTYGDITTAYRCDNRDGCDRYSGWTAVGYFLQR
jgi:hypothetical protein